MTRLVLASSSAARARLLAGAGIDAVRDPADIDEARIKIESRAAGQDSEHCALRLATAKAETVAARHAGALVLGADQLLECGGDWFDKPADRDDARTQLRALRGKSHDLVTAAAVLRDGAVLWQTVERPRLVMRHFTDPFLEDYLAAMGARVLTTVGGYELEGLGAQLMEQVDGDYFAILGLPLLPLLAFLRDAGALAA